MGIVLENEGDEALAQLLEDLQAVGIAHMVTLYTQMPKNSGNPSGLALTKSLRDGPTGMGQLFDVAQNAGERCGGFFGN
jgi:hypothetical protein